MGATALSAASQRGCFGMVFWLAMPFDGPQRDAMAPERHLSRMTWGYLWIAALLAPSLAWIFQDHSVWLEDQSNYGQVCADLWTALWHSPVRWAHIMSGGLYFKPPGLVWFGQLFTPLEQVLGSMERALLLYILLIQFATLMVLYRTGRRLFPQARLVSVVGVLFASASQLFVGLSHQMFTEPLQALAVAWTIHVAAHAPERPKARTAVYLGSALVLGALAKATTPLYCALPCVYASWFLSARPGRWDFRAEWKNPWSRAVIVVFGALGALCALWYLTHLRIAWEHVRDSSYGGLSAYYGSHDTPVKKLMTWSHLLVQSFLGPYLGWGILGAGILALVFSWLRRGTSRGDAQPAVKVISILCAVQVLILIVVFSLNTAVDARYMFAFLPSLVVVFMQLCAMLPVTALSVLCILAVAQFADVNAVALNFKATVGDQSDLLQPARVDRSQYDELTRAVQIASENSTKRKNAFNMTGVAYWVNGNSVEFFDAKRCLRGGTRVACGDFGYAQTDINVAFREIDHTRPGFLYLLSESYLDFPPDIFNVLSIPVLRRVRQDPRFTPVPFESRNGLLLFRFASTR